jgi:DNA replication licensing factor MCM4
MNDFRAFLGGFKIKYRTQYNRELSASIVEAGGLAPPQMALYDGVSIERGEVVLYEGYLKQLRETGETNLNLDATNLLAYPTTKRLYHQLINYPQEVIPIMDQVLRDIMVESVDEEFEAAQNRLAEGLIGEIELKQVEAEVREVENRVFKVRPFAGERTVNMRDLNPGGESGERPSGVATLSLCLVTETYRRHRQARQRQGLGDPRDPGYSGHDSRFVCVSAILHFVRKSSVCVVKGVYSSSPQHSSAAWCASTRSRWTLIGVGSRNPIDARATFATARARCL